MLSVDRSARGLGPAQVLLVEDSPSDRLMTTLALEESGVRHVLHTVEYGTDALRFLRREGPFDQVPRPDLILLDLNLPGMDGRDLLRRIKSDPDLRAIPIVVLTTSASPSDIRSVYENHANCYLRKPTDFRDFVDMTSLAMRFWCGTITPPVAPEPVPATPSPTASRRRLLLVEDSPTDALLFRATLGEATDNGFEVVHVDRVTAALDELERQHFDIIVSDLSLPDARGVESVRLLASAGSDAPIVVLTGSYAEVGEAALSAGADDFLPKNDLSGVRLTRIFRHAIRRRQLQSEELQLQRVQTVGRLAASVAHDMNNLLAAIRLTTEMLPLTGTEDAALATEILTNVERGHALTRQLLAFGRRSEPHRTPCRLNGAVASAASLLSRLLHRDVRLEIALADDDTTVLADAHQLEQAIINLGLNANDAMTTGGRLYIGTRVIDLSAPEGEALEPPLPAGRYLAVVVEDTGIGIPADVLPYIFDPFFTTKGEHEGTGLGLATVREIARLHRGSAMATNREGGGARFTLLLPPYAGPGSGLGTLTPAGSVPAISEDPPTTALRAPQRARHLLIAEDDAAVAAALCRVLISHGFTVHCTASADEAWAAWGERGGVFDGLITDLLMPGAMMVRELVERIRGEHPGFPVVYCSGFAGIGNEEVLELEEGVNFVAKPFHTEALLAVLEHQFRTAVTRP